MELYSGYPWWLLKDGLMHEFHRLDRNISVEAIIIGGGITGALMADSLTDAGIETALIEARTIGMGSTCASTSLLQYELDSELIKLTETKGEKEAARIYQLTASAVDKLMQIGNKVGKNIVEQRRSLYYASGERTARMLEKEFAMRKKYHFTVEFLLSDDLRTLYGIDKKAGILSSHSAQTDAYRLTYLLLERNIKSGLQVYDRTTAKKIIHTKKGVEVYTGEKYRISAKNMIWCTGFASQMYINKKIVDLDSTYVIISEPVPAENLWFENTMMWETARPYLYMRTTKDNRIIVGGMDDDYRNAFLRNKRLRKKAALLEKNFKKLMPHVPFHTDFTWAGTFGRTKDDLPYIGSYRNKSNSYFACGFGGNGITFSVIAADMIRDAVLGKKNPDAHLFSFDRKK